jgi:hypothetical protein
LINQLRYYQRVLASHALALRLYRNILLALY